MILNCWNHSEKSAKALCKRCHKPYCETCIGVTGKSKTVYCAPCHKQLVFEINTLEKQTVPILVLAILGGGFLAFLTYQSPESIVLIAEFTLSLALIAIGCVVHFRRVSRWRELKTLSALAQTNEKVSTCCTQCYRPFSQSEISLTKTGIPHCANCRELLVASARSDRFWSGALIFLGAGLGSLYFYLFFYLGNPAPLILAKGIFVASGLAMIIMGSLYLKRSE